MKSKELFMLIDQIDRRFIEEAWEGDEDSGKPIEVVLERSPFHAIKFAAAVAACIVMFGAGFFTIANIRTGGQFQPGSSGAAESPGSSSESELSGSDKDIEDTRSEISEMLENSSVSSIVDVDGSDEFTKQGVYKLDNIVIPYGDVVRTEIVEKADNYDYAVIYVEETNATEENPIIADIRKVDEFGEIGEVISERLYITGRGKYGFYYTELRGAGSGCILTLENDFKETINKDKSDLRIVGTWIP